MHVGGSDESVVRRRMMLGELVTEVDSAGFTLREELLLVFPILDPIEAHVNSIGALIFNGAV